MPAAAVIPAPIAYINFVAVKTLVVGFLAWGGHAVVPLRNRSCERFGHISRRGSGLFTEFGAFPRSFTLKKLKCSKQA